MREKRVKVMCAKSSAEMRKAMKRCNGVILARFTLLLFVLWMCCMVLSGCADRDEEENKAPNRIILTAAVLREEKNFVNMVEAFNQNDQEYYIEIKVYEAEEWDGSDALQRMAMEMSAGGGPDIIWLDDRSNAALAAGKLLEDLYPYMNDDQDFSKADYYENVWDAFSLEGNLYTLPTSFVIDTFAGNGNLMEDYVTEYQMDGASVSVWNIADLTRCYRDFSQNSTDRVWLFPGDNKLSVFAELCYSGMDQFVDWGSGECRFQEKAFIELLEFAGSFPDTIDIDDSASLRDLYKSGRALLYPIRILNVWSVAQAEAVFAGENVIFPGHPVGENKLNETGAVAYPADGLLTMNRNSLHKDGVWQFMKYCLSEQIQQQATGIPLLRTVSEERLTNALTPEYVLVDGVEVPKVRSFVRFEGEQPVELTVVTAENAAVFQSLVESIHRSRTVEEAMYSIVLEEAEMFFAGDRTAEKTADVIQSRVSLYVSERMR